MTGIYFFPPTKMCCVQEESWKVECRFFFLHCIPVCRWVGTIDSLCLLLTAPFALQDASLFAGTFTTAISQLGGVHTEVRMQAGTRRGMFALALSDLLLLVHSFSAWLSFTSIPSDRKCCVQFPHVQGGHVSYVALTYSSPSKK